MSTEPEPTAHIPHIPTPLEKYRGFVLFTSLAFAALYAELGVFFTLSQGTSDRLVATSIIAVVFVLTYFAFLASFAIPSRIYQHPKGDLPPQVLELLFQHWVAAAAIVLVNTAIVLGLYLYLTNLDLVAAYNLLKDLAIYAVVGCAFHGLLLYVRYAAYLYLVHQEDREKMIVATAGIGVLLVVMTLYLFTMEIMHLNGLESAGHPQLGLIGLHVYGRGLLLAGMGVAAYAWHIRWIGDH
ncbi:MAG: hypothetical protein KKA73_15600 [Chloroflexi bacterium]|nr:hypothetical protein [Chloroflexota bacterium]MBU1749110.1 hypothetical protein [Chloroflexota bacterium]